MTGDEFTGRYRLREQLTDGDIVSYLASDDRERNAFVHVFREPSAFEFDVSVLDSDGQGAVREILDVEGIPVVVTEVIEPFSTFESWVTQHLQTPGESAPGAFTRIFRVQAAPEAPEEGPTTEGGTPAREAEGTEPLAPEGAAVEEEHDSSEPESPGEFTRAFGALETPPVPPGPPASSQTEQKPPTGPPRPSGGEPAGTSPGAPSAEAPVPEEASPEPSASDSDARTPEPPVERGTGTFTRIMGAAGGSSEAGPVPPPVSRDPSPSASSSAPGSAGSAPPARPPGPPPPPRPSGPPPLPPWATSPPPRPTGGPPPPPRPGGPPPPRPPARRPPPPPDVRTPAPPPPEESPPPRPGAQGTEPGPYTRAMRGYRGSGEPPRTPPPTAPAEGSMDMGYAGSGSYLDRLRSESSSDDAAVPGSAGRTVPPPPPPGTSPTVPPVPSGPGDYTRVIQGAGKPYLSQGASGPSAGRAPPPVPAPPAPKGTPPASRTPIIVLLVVTLAALVALILFLALRSG